MPRGKTFADASAAIGDTPMIRINRLVPAEHAVVFAKCEFFQPLNSVKDRIGAAMIAAAERAGKINPETHIIEPTSGNTGIALAFVCAAKGYKLTLTMPESMSLERRALLRAMGAHLELTPAADGMMGAIRRASEMVQQEKNAWMPQQFENPANPEVHRLTTGPEILEATEGRLDAFVAGVGTGGTITGVGETLREAGLKVRVVAVEPARAPVLQGGRAAIHGIQGIGASFVPTVLNREIYDEVVGVRDEDAYEMTKRLSREEGLLVGISSGANVWAAVRVAQELGPGKRVVTMLCDTGERYLSVPL